MKKTKLLLHQTDQKINYLKKAKGVTVPKSGWINAIRSALNMSLSQLSKKLGMSKQAANQIEQREVEGSITLSGLKKYAEVMNMKFVYGFIPNEGSLENMIEKRAYEIAKDIVNRTSVNMSLEDQKNSEARLKKAVKERAEEIKREMPKYLWD
ncbi:MAG: mobile mystery protein A [Candidatus Delongbacteria bacterium]|nr:mobile mystery protein A [Candidatus Delongbacteria bacterium]